MSRIYSHSPALERTNDELVTSILIQQQQQQSNRNNEIMPIVKNGDSTQSDNGMDKSMFSVSRVKKVELSEMPRSSEICSTRKLTVVIV